MALVESRFLEGPNLYYTRPAVKLTVDVAGLLALPSPDAAALGSELRLRRPEPGDPGSGFRALFAARLLTAAVRRIARLGGLTRLAVRTRPAGGTTLVVAVPWRHTGKVDAFADGLAAVVEAAGQGRKAFAEALTAAGRAMAEAPAGESPSTIVPAVPTVGVTGTNGKTTTSRMIARIGRAAGLRTSWCSTSGVYVDGEALETGDWAGPGGARVALEAPGVQLAVLETARGGILRRGMAVDGVDVGVVTNVSPDHLGVDGVDTLEDLAEVKAVVPRAAKKWAVLNGDDPRTFAMRDLTAARVWVFSRTPDSPAVRTVLAEGGRATTVVDGWITVLRNGEAPLAVVRVDEIPMTLFGLSRAHTENSLAAATAALAVGLPAAAVAEGLRAFRPDQDSPGRLNVFSLDGTTILLDLAHNEASLTALLEMAAGLRVPGARILLAVGASGDRSDENVEHLGEIAALGADVVVVQQALHYLRGRTADSMAEHFAAGVRRAGKEPLAIFDSEVDSLPALVALAGPGDVVVVPPHEHLEEVVAWIAERGGTPDDPTTLKRKVEAARA